MPPPIAKLIASAVVFGLISLLGVLVGRGGGEQRGGARVLGYSAQMRGVGVLGGVVFPVVILGVGWLSPPGNPDDVWAFVGLILGSGLLGGLLMLEGFRTRVVLTGDGVAKFHWWYRPRFVAWCDVERVDARLTFRSDFAVRTRDGETVGVPAPPHFGPFEWFKLACCEHLRPDQYPAEFLSPPG